jgi:hypothetical protein
MYGFTSLLSALVCDAAAVVGIGPGGALAAALFNGAASDVVSPARHVARHRGHHDAASAANAQAGVVVDRHDDASRSVWFTRPLFSTCAWEAATPQLLQNIGAMETLG